MNTHFTPTSAVAVPRSSCKQASDAFGHSAKSRQSIVASGATRAVRKKWISDVRASLERLR